MVAPSAYVLVVDDHLPNLLAIEAVLAPLGHHLVMVSSGEEALRRLLQLDFAVILLDMQMAGMDGLETAALIKGSERTRHIPLMFVTAVYGDTDHIFRAYRQGAVDYLLKPIDPAALRAKVSVFVDLYVQREEIKRQAVALAEKSALVEQERRARAEAEAESRAREDAIAMVSHDLRNPLATIVMAAKIISKQLEVEQSPQLKNAAAIVRAADTMARILDDLLDISRIEGGRLALERGGHTTDVLLAHAVDVLQPLAAHRDQRVFAENHAADVVVDCDAARIAQVFSNLIGNAIKFSPIGGRIGIYARREGELVRFSVTDDGIGIPAHELDHIFERYWQARPADRTGIGLGLAIVKGIVEAHGGTIAVSSSPQGTTFTFALPITSTSEATSPSSLRS